MVGGRMHGPFVAWVDSGRPSKYSLIEADKAGW